MQNCMMKTEAMPINLFVAARTPFSLLRLPQAYLPRRFSHRRNAAHLFRRSLKDDARKTPRTRAECVAGSDQPSAKGRFCQWPDFQ
jgi:hypothetical protein